MWLGPDDQRQDYLDKNDITASTSQMVLRDENGKEFILDTDRPNPYGPVAQPILRLIKAYQEYNADKTDKAEEQAKIALADILGLVSNNSLFSKLNKVREGTESRYAREAPEAYNRVQETLPVSVQNVNRILNASEIVLPKVVQNVLIGRETEGSPAMKAAVGAGPIVTGKQIGRAHV